MGRRKHGAPFYFWVCLNGLFIVGLAASFILIAVAVLTSRWGAYALAAYWSVVILTLLLWEIIIRSRRSGKYLFKSHRRTKHVFSIRRKTRPTAGPHADLNQTELGLDPSNKRSGSGDPDGTLLSGTLVYRPDQDHSEEAPNPKGTFEDSYCHAPLLRMENEIRILQILPFGNQAVIRTKLVHMSLLSAQAKGYTALSYTWGSGEASSIIFVDGKQFYVRPNLASILRRLSAIGYQYVWIDAICINQNDLQECSAQVMRMQAIYAGAQSVLVAINTREEQAGKILQVLSPVDPEQHLTSQIAGVLQTLNDESTRAAFVSFCNDNYWERIWIVQEFAIGAKVDLLLHDSVISARKLESAILILTRQPQPQRWDQVYIIFNIRHSWHSDRPLRLLEILGRTSKSLCARRHDRVFGLAGLVPDALKFLTEPDYEADLDETTVSMTRSYIERHSLDILIAASLRSSSSTLPSWTPDYFRFDECSPKRRIVNSALTESMDQPQYGPRTRWHATGRTSKNVLFDNNVLISSARCIGSICSLGMAWSDPPGSGYPMHDRNRKRRGKSPSIRSMMQQAMLEDDYEYNPRFRYRASYSRPRGYSFVRAFLASHGTPDPESPSVDLLNWVSGNRAFFVGGKALQDHARRLWHPFFSCGLWAWNYNYFETDDKRRASFWSPFTRMAEQDMRLMCMDDESFGIGWAALGARLLDEVFLLPGCSVPVILRRKEDGKYQLIGDAIVIGAMENELWGNTKAGDLIRVEIV